MTFTFFDLFLFYVITSSATVCLAITLFVKYSDWKSEKIYRALKVDSCVERNKDGIPLVDPQSGFESLVNSSIEKYLQRQSRTFLVAALNLMAHSYPSLKEVREVAIDIINIETEK